MRWELRRRAIEAGSVSTWARLRLLPRPLLLPALLFLLSALAPATSEVASLLATPGSPGWLGSLARHPVIAGGLPFAAALVALLELSHSESPWTALAVAFTVLVGAVSFSGSGITFAKLQELMPTRPITFAGQPVVMAVVLAGALVIGAVVVVLSDVPDEFEAILLADRLLTCFAEPVDADGHEL